MADTRSPSELLLDYEKLKNDIIKRIATISGGETNFGQQVIQRIITSPLNTDNNLLVFTAQRIDDIINNISKLYKYGIRGDDNDVEQFVNFVETMVNEKNYIATQTKTFMTALTGEKSYSGLYNTLLSTLATFTEISRGINNKGIFRMMNRLKLGINNIIGLAPRSVEDLNKLIIKLTQNLKDDEPGMMELMDNALNNDRVNYINTGLPNSKSILSNMRTLSSKVAIFRRNPSPTNATSITDSLSKLERILFPNEEVWNAERVNNLAQRITGVPITPINEVLDNTLFDGQADTDIQAQEQALSDTRTKIEQVKKAGIPSSLPSPREIPANQQASSSSTPAPPPGTPSGKRPSSRRGRAGTPLGVDDLTAIDLKDINLLTKDEVFDEFDKSLQGRSRYTKDSIITALTNLALRTPGKKYAIDTPGARSMTDVELAEARRTALEEQDQLFGTERLATKPVEGTGAKRRIGRPRGSGLNPKTYSDMVKASTSLSSGIMETPRFVKFGKYLINNHKLHKDGIFALKTMSGGNLMDVPSITISHSLGNIFKTMIGGGTPSSEDFVKLSTPEKNYLHKIASKSCILDKFNVPAPTMNDHEKDLHQFEVMKGQLIAGNDSLDLIHKFKKHITRLAENGTLPKHQVNELLSSF